MEIKNKTLFINILNDLLFNAALVKIILTYLTICTVQ